MVDCVETPIEKLVTNLMVFGDNCKVNVRNKGPSWELESGCSSLVHFNDLVIMIDQARWGSVVHELNADEDQDLVELIEVFFYRHLALPLPLALPSEPHVDLGVHLICRNLQLFVMREYFLLLQ